MSTIAELLSDIEKKDLILPEFQRGFVWSQAKVKDYIDSIYRRYPTGHFLIWKTYKPQKQRGDAASNSTASYYRLILDGQQRLTALYTVFKGVPPPFFEGSKLYFRLYFNLATQEFEYWQPVKMRNKPEWIEVTPFLKQGVGNFFDQGSLQEELKAFYFKRLKFLNRLDQMRDYTYELETIPKGGEEIETSEVVRIFNLVNSSGMKLSKADLALAHICASWPEARQSLRLTHGELCQASFDLTTLKGRPLEFWVRALAAVATDSVILDGSFYKSDMSAIRDAWPGVARSAKYLVNVIRTDANVHSSSQLTTPYVLLPLIKHLSMHGFAFSSEIEKKRFLYWFYAAQMWGRYSAALDTDLQKDLKALGAERPTEQLVSNIISKVGRVKVEPKDIAGKGKTSRFFNMAYVAACNLGAIDWFNGMKLQVGHLGTGYAIQVHHIFPTSRLYKEGGLDSKNRAHIAKANEIANLAFLTREANLKASDELPAIYLPPILDKYPSALKTQFLPEDPRLFVIDNYDAFLEQRRKLIAEGINNFMESLLEQGTDRQAHSKGIAEVLQEGEHGRVEFKSSLRWDRKLLQVNKALELASLKTIAGFMNTAGGTLLLGIDDSRQVVGIEDDYTTLRKPDRDGYELHLVHLVSSSLGKERCLDMSISFHTLEGKDTCMVRVEPSPKPVYLLEGQQSSFYIRTGNQTQPLGVKESIEYVSEHWAT
jgi:hypothetical protein